MKVYVAICIDRHVDEYVRVFSTPGLAIMCCRKFIPGRYKIEEKDLTQRMRDHGWIYWATYGVEGDNVRVEEREIDRCV